MFGHLRLILTGSLSSLAHGPFDHLAMVASQGAFEIASFTICCPITAVIPITAGDAGTNTLGCGTAPRIAPSNAQLVAA
jgi:hypothetical protein